MQFLKPIKVSSVVDESQLFKNNEEEYQPVSPMSRVFHEPESNFYIIFMIGFNSKLNPEVIKANLQHSLLKHHRFSSLQAVDKNIKGGLKWVPTMVNLDDHVIIVPNLESECVDSPDKFVEDYVSNLSKTGITMSKPMWELHLLDIKTSDAESVAFLRMHHSLGDGTSLISLFLACSRKVSNPHELPTFPNWSANKEAADSNNKSCHNNKGFWPYLLLYKLLLFFSMLWNTLVDVVMLGAMLLMIVKDTETPLKGIGDGSGRRRRFVQRSVCLDDVKFVKNAMNATINDVMVAVTQAGLSQYLNRKYGDLLIKKGASERRNNNLPKNIRLRAAMVKNLRSSTQIQDLEEIVIKKDSKTKWGNQIGFMIFPFTIDLRDDPLDYLREAKAAMDRKKASLEAEFTYFISKYVMKFGIKGAYNPSKTTFLFSNMKGPQEEISFCGHPVAYLAPSCYGQPNGLMIHVVSCAKKMRFILSVDETVIPDPYQLCDDLEESLNLIKKAVIARGFAAKSKAF